jgi:hypothetical protein
MRKPILSASTIIYCVVAFLFLCSFQPKLNAQPKAPDRSVTVYQYRHVPDDKIAEFVKRETTYWSKVAEKAAKNKTMTFWALLEKVGGYDLPNSSNFLFINTFPNVDSIGDVFSDVEATTGMKIADIETNSMSTVTSEFFLHDENFEQATKAVGDKDFNYVEMVYHNTEYPDSLIKLEKTYWAPFIKKAMDAGQTPQVAWGNSRVLRPVGDNIKFTTVSYDLYKTMRDLLMPVIDPKTPYPTKALGMIGKLELNRRGISVYHVVKVVTSPN